MKKKRNYFIDFEKEKKVSMHQKKKKNERKKKKLNFIDFEREKKVTREKKTNLATTHPSVTGRTPKCKPQERWIGGGDWNHRRLPAFNQNTFL